MCVYFLPTHTIGESVLPAHFLRAFFFVGLSCGLLFVHVDRFFRARFIPLDLSFSFVGSFFRGSHSLRDLLRVRWVILYFMWVRVTNYNPTNDSHERNQQRMTQRARRARMKDPTNDSHERMTQRTRKTTAQRIIPARTNGDPHEQRTMIHMKRPTNYPQKVRR